MKIKLEKMIGWVKVHRKLSEKVFYRKDSEKVHLWIHLLICANRDEREELLGGKPIKCNPGQFTTGRKQLSEATGINESKIERILTYFEKIEQQIEQQKTSTNRLISILNWSEYQQTEQQSEQQVNNERTTSEQRANTLKEVKEVKKLNNIVEKSTRFIPPHIEEVKNYCIERKNDVDPQKWFDFYTAKNWMIGKTKMKDWKAAVRTWENNNKNAHTQFKQPQREIDKLYKSI